MHVPAGFAVVTPYILVADAPRYVEFLQAAFGAREIGRSLGETGRIANCQLQFETTTIMIAEAVAKYPPTKSHFYLYVADADAAMAQAIQAGATQILEVADRPYGDRQGGVQDPAGNVWWISQRLSAKGYF